MISFFPQQTDLFCSLEDSCFSSTHVPSFPSLMLPLLTSPSVQCLFRVLAWLCLPNSKWCSWIGMTPCPWGKRNKSRHWWLRKKCTELHPSSINKLLEMFIHEAELGHPNPSQLQTQESFLLFKRTAPRDNFVAWLLQDIFDALLSFFQID